MDQRRQLGRSFEDRWADDHYSSSQAHHIHPGANRTHRMNIFQQRHGLHPQHNEHSYFGRSQDDLVQHYMGRRYMAETKSLHSVSNSYSQHRKRPHESTYNEQDRGSKRNCTVVHNTNLTSLTNHGQHVQQIKPSSVLVPPALVYQQSQTSTYQQRQMPAHRMTQFQSRRPVNGTITDTLPYPAEGVEVVYTNNSDTAESWLKTNITDPCVNEVGFDIEWKPQFVSKKKGGKENKTAVVQLSVKTSCLVLHIFRMTSLPPSLCIILSDKKIFKVGSGIDGDVTKLFNDTGILCDGRVDTQECAKAVGIYQRVGLKHLSQQVLNIHLNKPKSVSMSNWEYYPLKTNQIQYAALDAWISLKLYLKLRERLDPENDMTVFSRQVVVHYGDPPLRKKQISKNMKAKERRQLGSSTSQSGNSQEISNISTASHATSSVMVPRSDSDTTSRSTSSDMTSSAKSSTATSLDTSNTTRNVSTTQGLRDAEHSLYSKLKNYECKTTTGEVPTKRSHSKHSKHPQQYICPIKQCRIFKFETEEELQQHIKSKHVCCKICGQVYRSKVKAKHKKLHANQQC